MSHMSLTAPPWKACLSHPPPSPSLRLTSSRRTLCAGESWLEAASRACSDFDVGQQIPTFSRCQDVSNLPCPIIQGPTVLPSIMDRLWHIPMCLGSLVLFHEAELKPPVLTIVIFTRTINITTDRVQPLLTVPSAWHSTHVGRGRMCSLQGHLRAGTTAP